VIVNHLSRLLCERQMSVRELAARTGLSYPAVHRLARDQTTRFDGATLDAICRVLDVGVGELLEYRAASPET